MTRAEILALLQETKAQTQTFFELPASELAKRYGPGKWSVRQILHHLADVEVLFIGRLKKIMAEPGQVIWAYDQDAWDAAFEYLSAPLNGKRELYATSRDENATLIDRYYDAYHETTFVHNRMGLRPWERNLRK